MSTGTKWTTPEEEKLKEIYGSVTTEKASEIIGRSAKACKAKAKSLGLVKEPKKPKPYDAQTQVEKQEVAILNAQATISRLETQFEVLRKEKEDLKDRVARLNKQTEKHKLRLDDITPHVVEKYLDSARKDATELHAYFRLMILKTTVATEVGYLVRNSKPEYLPFISKIIINAFDEPDSWWATKEHLTLTTWIEVLIEMAKKYQAKESVRGFSEK